MISGKETKILFLVSVIVISSILSCSYVRGDDSLNVQSDQTLYFQTTNSDHGWLLMNTSMPSGQGISQQTPIYFESPRLAQRFTFQAITATIYHEEILARGTYTLFVYLSLVDSNGVQHFVTSNFQSMSVGAKVTSLTTNFNTLLLEQEELFVEVMVLNTLGFSLQVYWGNSTYPSQLSYQGTAVYVPEFPLIFILPLFMIATLLAIVFYSRTKRTNQNKGNSIFSVIQQ